MTEHMNEDRDRREQERDLYFSRRNYIVERQKKIIDSIPNLITPIILIIIAIMILEPAKNVMSEYSLLLAAETSGMERIPELQKQIGVLEKTTRSSDKPVYRKADFLLLRNQSL